MYPEKVDVIMIDYKEITKQISTILQIKNKEGLNEIVALLQQRIPHYSWIGIYVVDNDMLHLGPWAGPQATEHVIIPIGRGICGSAAKTGTTEIIPDVKADDRYL